MNEEIFVKNTEEPKKPKRKLTEKQIQGLAKGREKMAEKRKMKKAIADKKKALAELDSKAVKENMKMDKEEKKAKKKVLAKQETELSYKEQKAKWEKSTTKFNKLKLDSLERIKSTKEMAEFEKIMSGVSGDISKDPAKLYTYLREHADRLAPEKNRKAYLERKIKNSKGKKSPKRKSAEHTEEIKPNLTLSIEE